MFYRVCVQKNRLRLLPRLHRHFSFLVYQEANLSATRILPRNLSLSRTYPLKSAIPPTNATDFQHPRVALKIEIHHIRDVTAVYWPQSLHELIQLRVIFRNNNDLVCGAVLSLLVAAPCSLLAPRKLWQESFPRILFCSLLPPSRRYTDRNRKRTTEGNEGKIQTEEKRERER